MAEPVGTVVAGYRIESLLARGGMGEVYLAEQDSPRRKVALKLLAPELASDPSFRERFSRESEAAASIDHPNVLPIYQSGEAAGTLYIAMRYVEGTDLARLLSERGPLEPERAAKICAQVADALQAAHDRGLVHRDVKPANVLLSQGEHVYLTDFGLIRRSEVSAGLTKTGQFMGTIDYAAPEQIRGEEVDGRADLYSLGCVLTECLTGRSPFRRDSEVATLYAHLEEPPPIPSELNPAVPAWLDAVAERAMAKRARDRFDDPHEMAEALRGAAPPHRPRRRTRSILAGSVAALVAVVLAGSVLTSGDDDGAPAGTRGTTTESEAIPLNSLVQIDAETGSVVSVTPDVPSTPAIDVGEGSVWVLAFSTLTPVDPADGSLRDSVTVGSIAGVPSLAVAERTVWVATESGVGRVSASDFRVLKEVRLPIHVTSNWVNVAAGSGNIWATTGDGDLFRIDQRTAEITDEEDIGQSSDAVTVGYGTVWVADLLRSTVTPVDPTTLEPGEPVQIAGAIDALEAGAGAVWVLDEGAGIVTPIDPETRAVGAPVRVGTAPTDLDSGLDSLWVTNSGDGTISRIDAITRSVVDTIDVGAPVKAIAVDGSSDRLWTVVAE